MLSSLMLLLFFVVVDVVIAFSELKVSLKNKTVSLILMVITTSVVAVGPILSSSN